MSVHRNGYGEVIGLPVLGGNGERTIYFPDPGKSASPPAPEPFPLLMVDDLERVAPPRDFVEGLLTEGGFSLVYGPSNCGKTFWVLDLAVSVATGAAWRNGERQVDQGVVIYFVLEGAHGFRSRLQALREEGRLPGAAPLYVCEAPVAVIDSAQCQRVIATARGISGDAQGEGGGVKLIVIDTLARTMAGWDENSGQDMTALIQAVHEIIHATGAHVCLVHHSGKDASRGARGHSSLRAAVDTEIEVRRTPGERLSVVRVTKQRDLESGGRLPFSLRPVQVGTDSRGRPVSSCVIQHEGAAAEGGELAAEPARPAPRKSAQTTEALLALLPADSMREWRERAQEILGMSQSGFYGHRSELEQAGAYHTDESGYLVVTE